MKQHVSEINTRFEGLNEPTDFDDKSEDNIFNALLFLIKTVYLISGVIIALIVLRFLLLLLAFTQNNAFASFIYSLTEPFVAPFYKLLNDAPIYNAAGIELKALISVSFYLLVTWLIVRLISFVHG